MQDKSQPMIKLANAGVSRPGRVLVEGVSLSISRGEIVALIGPNGSGKSTTARMVTGVIKPTSGEVWRARGLTIGYVPQKLTVDAMMPLDVERLMTLTGPLSPNTIDAALSSVGATHLKKSAVQGLSGGEFQRVLLARAIAKKPDLLVLDEPVQGVDFAGEVALYELIRSIRDETGCGILMISHDLHVVMAATDTVICLNGHVCCTGAPEQVANSPEYLSLFGARAAETLAIYQHHHDHTHLPDGRIKQAGGSPSDRHEPHGDHDHRHHHHH